MADLFDHFMHQELRDRIDRLGHHLRSVGAINRKVNRQKNAELEKQLLILSVINRALIELLADKGVAPDAEIRAKIQEVATRHLDGWDTTGPEDLASDLRLEVESPAERRQRLSEREALARRRLRHFRRQD